MRRIPVDSSRVRFIGVTVTQAEDFNMETKVRTPKRKPDPVTGELVDCWKVQALTQVEGEDKGELLEVNISGRKPEVEPLSELEFTNLCAQAWSMEGKSGVTFAADFVAKAGAAKTRPTAPVLPNGASS